MWGVVFGVRTAPRLLRLPRLRRIGDVGSGIGELVGLGFARWLFAAVSLVFLVAIAEAEASMAMEDFALRPRPRCGGVCSGAGGRSFRFVQECDFSPAVPLFVLPRVMAPVSAGEADLTAGSNRGVAPADMLLSCFRSRRLRRVATAATSTRLGPLKIRAGVSAAALFGFVFLSDGATTPSRAAADFFLQTSARGLGCFFVFSQGPFCNVGTVVSGLDWSCTCVFLI